MEPGRPGDHGGAERAAAGPDSTVVIGWCTTSSAESTPPFDFMT